MQTSKIEFKLSKETFSKYKKFCEENGMDMSKRLRIFIEKEIEYFENERDVIKELKKS